MKRILRIISAESVAVPPLDDQADRARHVSGTGPLNRPATVA